MIDSLKQQLFVRLQHSVPQVMLSRLTGRLADARTPWLKKLLIERFAATYKVDMSEAEREALADYDSFNDFFTRALKPEARPLGDGIVSPADGLVSQLGSIDNGVLLQAKGQDYCLDTLLGGASRWNHPFTNGSFATVYLSPSNYHRVHMPCSGQLTRTIYVPGQLFSVNQTTAAQVDNLFARNERLVCHFDTEQGPLALVLVGAMIVAGIETVWAGRMPPHRQQIVCHDYANGPRLEKGEEMGRFYLGSTVISCFGDTVEPLPQLASGTTIRQGEALMQFKQ